MNICNLDIDHFKLLNLIEKTPLRSLKNLPTTWGLRLSKVKEIIPSLNSEKPPHHMGIKTKLFGPLQQLDVALKNLPTTWGLRHLSSHTSTDSSGSEKPPHHMGIKTSLFPLMSVSCERL